MLRKVLVTFFMVLVLATMVSQVSANEVHRSWIVNFKSEKTLPSGDRAELINFLQKRNSENLRMLGRVKVTTPLWIANAAAISATSDEVAGLAQLPNVASIVPDQKRQWIRPGKDWRPLPGQATRKPVWSVELVKAPQVWSEFKIDGAGVVVGIIDSGIYEAHPALKGKVLRFKDFTPAQKTEPYDEQGHGTHVAGSIVGGDGVGVAPGARLLVAKVFDKTGNAEDTWVLGAMQWIMDPDGNPNTNDGPRLINNSWGSNEITDKSFWEATRAWQAAGILPVFAAGNNGPNGKVAVPANHPQCWAVGATTKSDAKAFFSSVGPITWDGVTLIKPDIAAPGAQVLSCSKNGGLIYNSGTSMACPHVAGLAALMLQAKPKMSLLQIRSIAESTAIDLGDAGKDNIYGSGRFDAHACISKVMTVVRLSENFAAYEEALLTEKALVGVGPLSPLAGPLAASLLQRARDLDAGEFRAIKLEFAEESAAGRLLAEAARLRNADLLHN